MNVTDMETPRNRREFEYRFHLLEESMIKETLHFCNNTHHIVDSLMRVRYLPNKRIDFLSVDEKARLQANMMYNRPIFDDLDDFSD